VFGSGEGDYDSAGELAYGLMFHGFDYPDETGESQLHARFWRPTMIDGCIRFVRPDDKEHTNRKFVREMNAKRFGKDMLRSVLDEATELGV